MTIIGGSLWVVHLPTHVGGNGAVLAGADYRRRPTTAKTPPSIICAQSGTRRGSTTN
jgi:hypothetical protein